MNAKARTLGNKLEGEKPTSAERSLNLMGALPPCLLSDLQKITYQRGLL